MTDRELMQQALSALEYLATQTRSIYSADKAIEALRARLEKWTPEDTAYRPEGLPQEEQELVTWARVNMNDHKEGDLGIGTVKWGASAPLVVTPHPAFKKPWVGLTDEEIESTWQRNLFETYIRKGDVQTLGRAIEAKLKEKNEKL